MKQAHFVELKPNEGNVPDRLLNQGRSANIGRYRSSFPMCISGCSALDLLHVYTQSNSRYSIIASATLLSPRLTSLTPDLLPACTLTAPLAHQQHSDIFQEEFDVAMDTKVLKVISY